MYGVSRERIKVFEYGSGKTERVRKA